MKFHFRCELTSCCFNSHDNLRFDELGDPIGPCYCTAPSMAEIFEEANSSNGGVDDMCPILLGLKEIEEDETEK